MDVKDEEAKKILEKIYLDEREHHRLLSELARSLEEVYGKVLE